MAKVRYNRNTGQFEVEREELNIGAALPDNPASAIENETLKPAGITADAPKADLATDKIAENNAVVGNEKSAVTMESDNAADAAAIGSSPIVTEEEPTATENQPAVTTDQTGMTTDQPAATTKAPQLDVEGLYNANQNAIKAQEAAVAAEQAAYQSSIDQYNDMVRRWQQEANQQRLNQVEAEKRARVSMLVSGIADGVAALTNLYYTTKGAPNIQLHSGLEKYQGIYDRAQQRRDALRRELNLKLDRGVMNLAQMRQQQAIAKAKGDAGVGAARAQAEAAKIKGIYDNAVQQQKQNQYDDAVARQAAKDQAAENKWREQFEESKRHNQASERISSYRASHTGSGKADDNYIVVHHEGKTAKIPHKYAEAAAEYIFDEASEAKKREIAQIQAEYDAAPKKAKLEVLKRLRAARQELDEMTDEYKKANSESSLRTFTRKHFKSSPTAMKEIFDINPDVDIDFDDPKYDGPTAQDPYAGKKRK